MSWYLWMFVVAGGFGLGLTGAFGLYAFSPRRLGRTLPTFDRLDVRTAHRAVDGPAVIVTKPPLPEVVVAAGDGRRDGPPHWIARAQVPAIGARASLLVERRRGLSSPVGLVDVSPAFDARYALTSDAPDVVRAWFTEHAVVAALDAIFTDPACIDVAIARKGAVQVRVGLGDAPDDLERAVALARSIAALLSTLSARTDAAPVTAAVAALGAHGAASDSGVPVLVPQKLHTDSGR